MSSSQIPHYCYYSPTSKLGNMVFVSMSDGSREHKTIRTKHSNSIYFPANDGWIVILGSLPEGEYCSLLNLNSDAELELPFLPPQFTDIVQAIVFGSPTPTKLFVLFNDFSDILSWEKGDKDWKLQHVSLDDDDDFIFSVLFSKGKLYGFTYWTSLVDVNMEDGTCSKVAALDNYSIGEEGYENRWMMESKNGDIMLVYVTYLRRNNSSMLVQVYKVDLSKEEFVEVDSIGDEAMFVGWGCDFMCSVPVQSGFRRNCVYILINNDDGLYCYDMDDCSISMAWPISSHDENHGPLSWILKNIS